MNLENEALLAEFLKQDEQIELHSGKWIYPNYDLETVIRDAHPIDSYFVGELIHGKMMDDAS